MWQHAFLFNCSKLQISFFLYMFLSTLISFRVKLVANKLFYVVLHTFQKVIEIVSHNFNYFLGHVYNNLCATSLSVQALHVGLCKPVKANKTDWRWRSCIASRIDWLTWGRWVEGKRKSDFGAVEPTEIETLKTIFLNRLIYGCSNR